MQLHIKGHHVDITPALNDMVESKIQKLEHHFPHITNIYVTLKVEKNEHSAEAEVSLAGAKNKIFAEANTDDMYGSIDEMISKLDRQVVKHKEKLNKRSQDSDKIL